MLVTVTAEHAKEPTEPVRPILQLLSSRSAKYILIFLLLDDIALDRSLPMGGHRSQRSYALQVGRR